jgi:hypothetical protein
MISSSRRTCAGHPVSSISRPVSPVSTTASRLAPDGSLRLGALATMTPVADHSLVRDGFPALSQALLASANGNIAEYLVPVNADVGQLEVVFVDEHDPHVNPLGVKGVGEIALVGVAAAIAQCGSSRDGKARPRPADHAGEAALAAPIPFTRAA